MKIFVKFLKGVGILLFVLLLIAVITYYRNINYKTYDIQVERSYFPEVNTAAEIEALAKDLISEMTFEEKVDQMYGEKNYKSLPKMAINFLIAKRFPHIYVGKNERLHIPPWVLSDGPRGARVMHQDVTAVTTFPVAMARGASWDVSLEKRIQHVIAIEMRANKVNLGATPCINILRHPAWGRAQETYGEDPWLLGEFGLATVKALESHNVMASPKHFALNSLENSRWVVNVEVDERTLREVYLPHFKKTIQQGKPAAVMSAYNQINGEYCGHSKRLLTDILRTEWGFEGFVNTDWEYGVYDGVAGVKAGLNVEMPSQNAYSVQALQEGIDAGKITEEDIDDIVVRSLKTRLKYAFTDDEQEYTLDKILLPEHIALAREAAEKSMVLLKNNSVLPFKKKGAKKIAVIGRLADVENTGDEGSSDSTPPYVITPFQGISNYHKALGNQVILNDGSDLESAKKLATEADEVIVVVGYTREDEGEYIILFRDKMVASAKAQKLVGSKGMGGDRDSLRLRPEDEQLIEALASTNDQLVVTYIGGSAIDMNPWQDEVPAILFAWYGGMEGGNALANILYGKVNPSGKLPFSIAKNEKEYPYFNPYIENISYGYYHGYTLFDKKNIEVAYPFGFGLSYTNYAYSNLQIAEPTVTTNGNIQVTIDIENTGDMAGEEIVQLYVGFKNSEVDRPVKLLRAFDKVNLQPGEKKTIPLQVSAQDLAWYNPQTKKWEIEVMDYELYVGGSSATAELLTGSFKLE